MNNNLDHIDKLFKDGLENASAKAPEGVWEVVSSSIATTTVQVVATKSFFAVAKWWILGTVVTATSVATYITYSNSEVKIPNKESLTANNSLNSDENKSVENGQLNNPGSIVNTEIVANENAKDLKTQENPQIKIENVITPSQGPKEIFVDNPVKIIDQTNIINNPKTSGINVIPVSRIYSQLNSKNSACKWEKVSIGFESKGSIKVFWNFGDDVLVTTYSSNTSHTYKQAGNYTITADVFDLETGIKLNTLYKEVKIGFNVNVNYRLVGDNTFRFETDANYENMQWLFPENGSQAIFGSSVEHLFEPEFNSGKVINICKNDLGCSDTFITWVKNSKTPKIEIFDAFTPNGDGTNDKYYVLAQGYEYFSLTIMDMTGKLLFNTTNPQTGWDGKFNGISCEKGIYWARVTYKFPGKNTETKTEQITLVKN